MLAAHSGNKMRADSWQLLLLSLYCSQCLKCGSWSLLFMTRLQSVM